MRAPAVLLDRHTVERLERLTIRWSQSFRGRIGGDIVSRYPGVGHEFLDHRHFQRGDDLKAVNWRAFMRLERMFLKLFRSEPRIPVRILIDTSESMAYGGDDDHEPKFPFACRLAAALCYVGLVRLETIVLQPFSSTLGESFRAHGGRPRYARAARFLSGLKTGGRTAFQRPVRDFLVQYRAPGLTFVLSDFLTSGADRLPFEHWTGSRHEVHLLHLSGPADREPPWRGDLELFDAESDSMLHASLDDDSARAYRAEYDAFCARTQEQAERAGAHYLHLSTTQPLDQVLFHQIPATSTSGPRPSFAVRP